MQSPVVVEIGIEVPVVGIIGTVITGGTIGKGIIGGNILTKDAGAVVVGIRYGNIMLGGTTNDGSGRNGKHIGGCGSKEVVLLILKSSLRLLRGGVIVFTTC